MAKYVLSFSLSICLLASGISQSAAAPPSESLLPTTSKGFLSTPSIDLLIENFNATQLGELVNDPVMEPFVEDVKRQMKSKLTKAGVRIGLSWSDLEGVASGEVTMCAIQPGGKKDDHALAMTADVTGREQEAQELLAKIDKNQLEKGAKKSTSRAGDIELTVYTLSPQQGETRVPQKFYGLHDDTLFATDHPAVAEFIAMQLSGSDAAVLATVDAFRHSMEKCQNASLEVTPNVRWFVEPFGFAEVTRAANGGRKKRGTDLLKVLRNQGFTAVQGLGGYVTFATEQHEILHRTFVYAPPVERADDEPGEDKYDLAARMLQFPNGGNLKPQAWVPRDLATYLTFNWKMKDAFEHSKSLVNEYADDEVFEEVLKSIKNDPSGPQIDVRKELIAFLGERATLLADYRPPINPKSERVLFAIDVTNPDAVERTVAKAMEHDPTAKKRVYEGKVIWEIINEEVPVPVTEFQIQGAGFSGGQTPFGFGDKKPEEEDEDKPKLPNSAVTVAHGCLIIATHVDFIRDILKDVDDNQALADARDYQLVSQALAQLNSGNDSFQLFTRTDEAYRVTYELMKQGKMPQAESLFGKLLNRLMQPDEEGTLREQQIDGAKMPDYQAVRRYLGPAGAYIQSDGNGWFVVGCLLTK